MLIQFVLTNQVNTIIMCVMWRVLYISWERAVNIIRGIKGGVMIKEYPNVVNGGSFYDLSGYGQEGEIEGMSRKELELLRNELLNVLCGNEVPYDR